MNIRTDIKLLPTASLREADTNAKKHTEEQVSTIARSIERFGFNVPLVVSKDNEVVAGHGRLFAAKKLGLTEVPCLVVDDLTADEIEAYRLADNQLNMMTGFDMPTVVEGLRYLSEQKFDITLTGFDPDLVLGWFQEPTQGKIRDRFLIPPFSVLNARDGAWQERKQMWLRMGIESETGRDENLLGDGLKRLAHQCS